MKTKATRFLYSAGIFAFCGILAAVGMVWAEESNPRCAVNKGDKAPSFTAKSLGKKAINFPDDFKGKVVLLDFWATWCGPCRAELPNVSAAYGKYHDKGFEVVSVSLDQPQRDSELLQFVHEHKMIWPQIYDGGLWQAAVAKQYGVRAIPCPVIVDGDSGKVLAVGGGAIGGRLKDVLEKALAEKSRNVAAK